MRSIAITFLFCAAAFAQPAQTNPKPYIERGDIDLALTGNLSIPHSDPGSVSGAVAVDLGYYVSDSSLVGGVVTVRASSGAQSYGLLGHYRYLFHTHNPKLFPFVGGSPGLAINHSRYGSSSRTDTAFIARGEAGVKYFVVRNVAFEAAYRLMYARQGGTYSTRSTVSALDFGFAFTF
jgi:hypothetical protein